MTLSHLRTLLWKAWIVKKHEPKSTCCEFFLPLLFVAVLLLSFNGTSVIPAGNFLSMADPWQSRYSSPAPVDYTSLVCGRQTFGLVAENAGARSFLGALSSGCVRHLKS